MEYYKKIIKNTCCLAILMYSVTPLAQGIGVTYEEAVLHLEDHYVFQVISQEKDNLTIGAIDSPSQSTIVYRILNGFISSALFQFPAVHLKQDQPDQDQLESIARRNAHLMRFLINNAGEQDWQSPDTANRLGNAIRIAKENEGQGITLELPSKLVKFIREAGSTNISVYVLPL